MVVRGFIGMGAAAVLLAGCAKIPEVTEHYYFPKAETQIAVTQTIGCNADNTLIRAVTTVTPTTTYSSDRGPKAGTGSFTYSDFNATFSDGDAALTFTDDHRLAGVNTTSQGQGDAILKNLITLAAIAAPAAIAAAVVDDAETAAAKKKKAIADGCAAVVKYGSTTKGADGKPALSTLTLTYGLTFFYVKGADKSLTIQPDPAFTIGSVPDAGPTQQITPTPDNSRAVTEIQKAFPALSYSVQISPPSFEYLSEAERAKGADSSDMVMLELNRVAMAGLEVLGPTDDLSSGPAIWKGEVPVPVRDANDPFLLPIPKPKLFGSENFTLTLSSYGSVSKLEYGKKTGATDATDAAGVLAKALAGPTDAQKAAALQAHSDLIYQHNRALACQLAPSTCPGK